MRYWPLCLVALLASTACGSDADRGPRSDAALEIYSWWVNPGEKRALDALIGRFSAAHPQTSVIRGTASSQAGLSLQVEALLSQSQPPDTFQTVGGADLLRWVLYNGVNDSESLLEPVNAAAQTSGLFAALPSVIRNALSYQDRLYAIPLDVPRVNVLLYNTGVFSGYQLEPPATLEEFFVVAEALKARGVIPLALGTRDGSVVSQMLFDGVLLAEAGVTYRDAYLDGAADPADPRVAKAVASLGRLLEYTNPDHDNVDWTQAARLVVDGAAAMTITGDWAKAFFDTTPLAPGNGLGQVVFPGTQGIFAYLVDGFTLPQRAPNRDAAVDFLASIATKDAADVFTRLKLTTAARLDVDRSAYDVITQGTAEEFRSSTLTLGHRAKIASPDYLTELDRTLRQFAVDRKTTPVVNMLQNHYGRL